MVRLKEDGGNNVLTFDSEFQFHMVRLKERRENRLRYPLRFQFHMVRLKGTDDTDDVVPVTRFQFHMVRLKVYADVESTKSSLISIPHGTIKSNGTSSGIAVISYIFQFHMVRLKVIACVIPRSSY